MDEIEFEKRNSKKEWSKRFKIFFYGGLAYYLCTLGHMVAVSVIPSSTQSAKQMAFTTPLVIITLLIPFHLQLKVRLDLIISSNL